MSEVSQADIDAEADRILTEVLEVSDSMLIATMPLDRLGLDADKEQELEARAKDAIVKLTGNRDVWMDQGFLTREAGSPNALAPGVNTVTIAQFRKNLRNLFLSARGDQGGV